MGDTAQQQRRGADTRAKCLKGAYALLADVSRRLKAIQHDKETKTLTIEITSAYGVLSAIDSETHRAVEQIGGCDPSEILAGIMRKLDDMALPECHKTIKIEIVSVEGAMSAVETGSNRHRWDF